MMCDELVMYMYYIRPLVEIRRLLSGTIKHECHSWCLERNMSLIPENELSSVSGRRGCSCSGSCHPDPHSESSPATTSFSAGFINHCIRRQDDFSNRLPK